VDPGATGCRKFYGLFITIYGLLFAHYAGSMWALLAAAILLLLRLGRAAWIGPAGSLAAAALTGAAFLLPGLQSPLGSTIEGHGMAFTFAVALTHLGAVSLCRLMVCGWLRGPDAVAGKMQT
jgi:hypothetical protein